ncbi:MAG: nucleotidyltransferase domain-containing protein [Promethearchaeota archaeon]
MTIQLKKILGDLFKSLNVDFAYLGGTWVRNQNSWWSDIDIFISMPSFFQKTLFSKKRLNKN